MPRAVVVMTVTLGFTLVILFFAYLPALVEWAIAQQRAYQSEIAAAVYSIKAAEAGAFAALLLAAGLYGFVHALGPGHGKFVLGSVGVGSQVSRKHLAILAVSTSFLQAIWAVILAYGCLFLFEATLVRLTGIAEGHLSIVSYTMVSAIGAFMFWRGLRIAWPALSSVPKACGCCGGHDHAVTEQTLSGWNAAALVSAIAVRPCSGALILLLIAWQMDIKLAGVAATLIMGLGTATAVALVALGSTLARDVVNRAAKRGNHVRLVSACLQCACGVGLVGFGLALIGTMAGPVS